MCFLGFRFLLNPFLEVGSFLHQPLLITSIGKIQYPYKSKTILQFDLCLHCKYLGTIHFAKVTF